MVTTIAGCVTIVMGVSVQDTIPTFSEVPKSFPKVCHHKMMYNQIIIAPSAKVGNFSFFISDANMFAEETCEDTNWCKNGGA